MGRRKQYRHEDVLDKGLQVFWHYGYDNLTIDDLVKHTGLNRDSMYKAFGNKQQFFIAVMQHYIDWIFTYGPGKYFSNHQGVEAISSFISGVIDLIDEKGCFITNTDANYLAYPKAIQVIVDGYKQRLKRLFLKNLQIENNETNQDCNVLILLAFFSGAVAIKKGENQAEPLKQALERLLSKLGLLG